MEKLRAYLDTNILSRITDLRISQKTINAYGKLSEFEFIDFVTSDKTKREFGETRNSNKASILSFLYKIIDKIPPTNITHFGGGGYASSAFGGTAYGGGVSVEDPLFKNLKNVFDQDDAEHIFHAIKASCNYFLTLDKKTILNRAKLQTKQLKTSCLKIVFCSPEKLVEIIEQKI
jgi:hypothetical protein